jgi:cytochrome c peroxidase
VRVLASLLLAALGLAACGEPGAHLTRWSPEQLRILDRLALDALPALQADPSNAVADDPRAAALGHRLFFDERLSANGEIACASCHQPALFFTDGLPLSKGIGTTGRHAPSLVAASRGEWFFWDGRADSQWAQALGPLEHPAEHGATRTLVAQVVGARHRAPYEELFGPLPPLDDGARFPASAGPQGNESERAAWAAMSRSDRHAIDEVFTNAAKAIAAYQRLIQPGRAPFDEFVGATRAGDHGRAREILGDDALKGLRLFIGDARCTECHSGPLFTNGEFHAIGVPEPMGVDFDRGRADGALTALGSPFNCLGSFSDAEEIACVELRFLKTQGDELLGAMKVPTLRNVAETAPYMHRGQRADLQAVFAHYVEAPVPAVGHTDLSPLPLSQAQLEQLEAFLRTLTGPLDMPAGMLEPPPED